MTPATALFGGSFDPIHFGHLIIARSVREQLGLDQVVFLPSAAPPHKGAGSLSPPQHRAAMVSRAIEDEPGFAVSDFDLARPGPTYTIETVAYFREHLGATRDLCWIIGSDSLAELSTWHQVEKLVDLCRIVTAIRAGDERPDLSALKRRLRPEQVTRLEADILPTPRIDISATDIRRRVADGESIRYLVPEPVRAYIRRHGLYSPAAGGLGSL
jgi:nicotinate-nucleotide adenylyltransferase